MTVETTQSELPGLLDEKGAAQYLGISVEFLQKDRQISKRIPYVKFGRAVRYDLDDLIAFKNACKVRARDCEAQVGSNVPEH